LQPKTPWCIGEVRLQKTVELEKGFFIKDNIIQILRFNGSFPQTVVDRMHRQSMIMLDPRKSLFLSSGDDPAVPQQGGRTVMIET
jgi:hypothetical protein